MILKKIKSLLNFLIKANVIKTVLFNYQHLPFNIAIKLPIHLYGPVHLCDDVHGRISFLAPSNFGSWRIGEETGLPWGASREVTYLTIEGDLFLGRSGTVSNGCIICVRSNAKLTIGDDFWMGHRSKIISKGLLTIGHKVRVSWESQILDSDFHFLCDADGRVRRHTKVVHIGDYCWIGNRVTIAKGTCLGNYSIVAASSFVNKDFGPDEHCIYGGVPARKIKTGYSRLYWDKQLPIEKWFAEHPEQEICNINELNI